MKKILSVGIILLFLGVSVVPSINTGVVTASQDDDLVEVTTQACGIQGYGDTTVKLTRQQYQNLEQYLVEFRARLNQTSTREEAIPIFKEAVVELDRYGLLPRGMSVERAQECVINGYYVKRITRLLGPRLIAGRTSNTCIIGPVSAVFGVMYFALKSKDIFYNDPNFHNLVRWLNYIARYSLGYLFFKTIILGYNYSAFMENYKYPATGWISSFNLFSSQNWNGTFNGLIKGCCGIKIRLGLGFFCDSFYLCSALSLKIVYV